MKDKFLIIHADDFGMSCSVNSAILLAFGQGAITSASIMVPCPWFCHAASQVCQHPELDVGIHLTLTCEWSNCRWGPVAPQGIVPTLVDPDGFLWRTTESFISRAAVNEVKIEMSAQIERAAAAGIRASHIDSHMFTSFATMDLLEAYVSTADKYEIPFLSVRRPNKVSSSNLEGCKFRLDGLFQVDSSISGDDWADAYQNIITHLPKGVSQLIVHPGFDDSEMQALTAGQRVCGSSWRQRDFDVITSERFRKSLANQGVTLIAWKDVERVITAIHQKESA